MKLRVYLADKEMKTGEFARLIDRTPGYVNGLMRGTVKPSLKMYKRIEEITKGAVVIEPSTKTAKARKALGLEA